MASTSQPVVVDTNVLFSALLRNETKFADLLLKADYQFCVGESVLIELFRRKEKLISLSGLSEDDLSRLYHLFLRRMKLCKEDSIPRDSWSAAYDLCRDIDESDTPHVALALALNGLLWTGDKKLKSALQATRFDSFFSPDASG